MTSPPPSESLSADTRWVKWRKVPARRLGRAMAARSAKPKYRMVYDASQWLSGRLRKWPFRYTSHARIMREVRPGSWIASVDIESGFHHIVIGESSRKYLGITLAGTEWQWTRLPFVLQHGPAGFSALSAEVVETMQRRLPTILKLCDLPDGSEVVWDCFMDDIFIVANSKAACEAGLLDLMAYCKRVGIALNESKTRWPLQKAAVLGLEVDTLRMTISLPDDKRCSMANMTAIALHATENHLRLDKGFWMKLVGKLGYACEVVPDGRAYIPVVWEAAYDPKEDDDLTASLAWWLEALCDPSRTGERLLIMPMGPEARGLRAQSDASGEWVTGFDMDVLMGWWHWDPATSARALGGRLIRQQELIPWLDFVRDAIASDWFSGMMLDYATDNASNASVLNKGRSRDPILNEMIRAVRKYYRTGNCDVIHQYMPPNGNVPSDDMPNAKTNYAALACAEGYFAQRRRVTTD